MVVKVITESNFEQEVLKSKTPVLLDFWAEWCGPCKALAPILDDLSNAMNKKLKIVKIDVDKNASLAQQYAVRGIPTLLLFQDGEVKANKIGSSSLEDLKAWVESNL